MIVSGTNMSFSSYPGVITSIDDFYILSSGLVAMETAIGNYNRSLWHMLKPTGNVCAVFVLFLTLYTYTQ